jgi:hypothetical protein
MHALETSGAGDATFSSLLVGQKGAGQRGTKKAKQGMAIYLFLFYESATGFR